MTNYSHAPNPLIVDTEKKAHETIADLEILKTKATRLKVSDLKFEQTKFQKSSFMKSAEDSAKQLKLLVDRIKNQVVNPVQVNYCAKSGYY